MQEQTRMISAVEAEDGGRVAALAPRLELGGSWLAEAGFPVGAQVEVAVVEPGRLVVMRLDLEGPLPNLFPLVWVPVENLGPPRRGWRMAEQ